MVEQKLFLNQSQSLVMTPQLQQAIKLLQLSHQELAAYLDGEVAQNPLLEKADGGDTADVSAENNEASNALLVDDISRMDSANALNREDGVLAAGSEHGTLDVRAEDFYSGESVLNPDGSSLDYKASRTGASHTFGSDDRAFDETMAEKKSLRDHLMAQINVELSDPADRLVAVHLVDGLDEHGYLREDLDAIAAVLETTVFEVKKVLKKVQQFDPAGCFARSLGECLALQLAEKGRFDPAMGGLLDHLELLAQGKVDELCKICYVDMADLADMVAEIKALNPRPGDAFRHEEAQTLIADVVVKVKPDGDWAIELNTATLPRVLLNNRYYAEVSRLPMKKEDKKYISECHQNASWLIKALNQRAETILKVGTEIVRQQDDFLRKGIKFLKPLTLKDIAEKIGMHESTVSRVTTAKYIATPRGTFELKYFFTSSVTSSGGEVQSSEYVRQTIKELIDAEPAGRPYSDDQLVSVLRDKGIDVARRTIAKYREQLGIGSSTDRRRQGKLKQSF